MFVSRLLGGRAWVLFVIAGVVAGAAVAASAAPGGMVVGGEAVGGVPGDLATADARYPAGSGVDIPNVPAPTTAIDALTPAELADLATIAKQEGIALDEAIERYAWQEPFSILVQEVREAFPAEFSGARIEADGSAWIGFSGRTPEQARTWINTFEHSVSVRTDLGFNEAELDSRLTVAYEAASGQSDLVGEVYAYYDIATGEINMLVEPKAPTRGSEGKTALAAQLLNRLPSELAGVNLEIVDTLDGGGDAIRVYGGEDMTGGGHVCTAGFTVSNSYGIDGISTAAHCPESGNPPTMTWNGLVSVFLYAQHQGSWGDVQWLVNSSAVFVDDFLADTTDYRDVAGVAYPVEGQTLFRYGITTGRQHDTVAHNNVCNYGMGACHLTEMSHMYGQGGDSGGPWYFGNTAYGIHEGYVWVPFHYADVFTPASYFLTAIGVQVKS